MATLGTFGLVSYLSMGGSKKKEQGPALNASSKDEENFIRYAGGFHQCNRLDELRITRLTVEHAVTS
jgi:hypothetical protein